MLAVVLIIALVAIALLGFFPGTASDAQISESEIYWKSAQPISIVESGARFSVTYGNTYLYLRLRNAGTYPIRITAVVGADGAKATQFFGGGTCGAPSAYLAISDYFYLGPGEEKYFAWTTGFGTACNWQVIAATGGSGGTAVGGASSVCQNSTASPGVLDYKTLGFEYVTYVEGQQLTKRQVGKKWIVKCLPTI